MKYKKINNRFKLMNPVLQIAGYMIWSGARVGMLLAYPSVVWFEIENNENKDVFNIKVYPLLEMNSFEEGMVEIVRILKYASKLEPNKKMFRGKVDEDEEKKEDKVEKKKIKKQKRTFSEFQSEEKEIDKTEKKQKTKNKMMKKNK
ncbi:hypothetical protein RFI_25857 [Reticulomyxa filosa]|uniref:Uncharacterized protein n=1 Tax=Reticulomyxa filosa TaxID=46433 RepID=X6MBX9_RETFI|nr:hypothetical protein RFI_25857 [Reticulomyxa filosa]|eukprot:ETO11518.1 hypothetical protein RFI_25857 [Reticulomyxa filosa]